MTITAAASESSVNGQPSARQQSSLGGNVNSKGKKEELVALMQRSVDGTFYFSSAAPKQTVDSISKREITKIRILPSASIGRVANLGTVSAVRPVMRRAVSKRTSGNTGKGGHVKAPVFLNYGEFSSFAPCIDSSTATLSAADAIALYYPKRRVEIEKRDMYIPVPAYDTLPVFNGKFDASYTDIGISPVANSSSTESVSASATTITEKDIPEIKKALENTSCKDIDIAALLKLPSQYAALKKTSPVPVFVDDLIKENQYIIKELMDLQKERYLSYANSPKKTSSSAPAAGAMPSHLLSKNLLEVSVPSAHESILADTLLANLSALTRWSRPSSLVVKNGGSKSLAAEVERMAEIYSKGALETSWRGELSLGGGKHKAVATNIVGDPSFGV